MNLRLVFLSACVAGLVLPSCRSTKGRDAEADRSGSAVAAKLEMLDPRIEGDGPDRALVLVLRNRTDEYLATALGIDWFDARGRALPLQSTAWIPLMVEGHATHGVRVAPMPVEARSWRLRFLPD